MVTPLAGLVTLYIKVSTLAQTLVLEERESKGGGLAGTTCALFSAISNYACQATVMAHTAR